jgi:hypothetical protein
MAGAIFNLSSKSEKRFCGGARYPIQTCNQACAISIDRDGNKEWKFDARRRQYARIIESGEKEVSDALLLLP